MQGRGLHYIPINSRACSASTTLEHTISLHSRFNRGYSTSILNGLLLNVFAYLHNRVPSLLRLDLQVASHKLAWLRPFPRRRKPSLSKPIACWATSEEESRSQLTFFVLSKPGRANKLCGYTTHREKLLSIPWYLKNRLSSTLCNKLTQIVLLKQLCNFIRLLTVP